MKHIILIGFKNAGKTVVGKGLAKKLGREFLDLDAEIEKKEGMTAREIVLKEGEMYFRNREAETLKEITRNTGNTSIIALGGGAAMAEENQKVIREHIVVLVTAPKEIVFERIMKKGRPAFFPKDLPDREAFEKLYAEREVAYERIAKIRIKNEKSVESAVEEIIRILNLEYRI
jgi:shikimate kinase